MVSAAQDILVSFSVFDLRQHSDESSPLSTFWIPSPPQIIEAPISENYCSALLKRHLPADFDFPTDCRKFDSFRSGIVRRDSKEREENVAFAGMDAGAAIQARSARAKGRPNQAQLIRRMSSRKHAKESSWF